MQFGVGTALQLQQVAHTGLQHRRRVGFGNEVRRAEVECTCLVAGIGEPRDEGDRDVPELRVRLERAADVETVQPRHVRVEQDEVGEHVPGHPKGFFPRLGEIQLAHLAQCVAQDVDRCRVIVHDQDPRCLLQRWWARGEPLQTPVAPQIFDQGLAAQLRPHSGGELRRQQRLAHEIRCTFLQCGHLQCRGVVAGDEDDRHVGQRRVGLEGLADAQARQAWHFSIHEDEVGPGFARESKGHLARRREALVGIVRQHPPRDLDGCRIVVHEKQTGLLR